MPGHHAEITPELMMRAYRAGLFPMAERRDGDRLYWLDPERRGVLPLAEFHLPRRLARTLALPDCPRVTCDGDFAGTIALCAEANADRPETWINRQVERLFRELHEAGHAHSVECRDAGGRIVGGLYGVALGGVFFGESMVSRVRDASKIALAHLVARLNLGGFAMLDTQFVTPHLARFGVREVPRDEYRGMLDRAAAVPARWIGDPPEDTLRAELRRLSRTAPDHEPPEGRP